MRPQPGRALKLGLYLVLAHLFPPLAYHLSP